MSKLTAPGWFDCSRMARGVGVLALCLIPLRSQAQTVNAALYGIVRDQAGAAIPDARMTATDLATSISTAVTSGADGSYTFPNLAPATYSLMTEKTGFRTSAISGITLLVDQKARIDVQLQVGSVNATIQVTGAAPLVDSNTASVGTVVGQREVVDLPLNLRRFGSLAVLVPGTTTDNGGFASSEIGSPFSETTYAANGARSSSNNTLIDGADSRNLTLGGFAVQPSPDAVQEFRIQTNIYDAAFGKTAGSTINLITKSGSNSFHGTAYEFLRNDLFDARNFFSVSAKPEFRRNQYGASIGGPIRKRKTFFFGNYEGLRLIQQVSRTATVPAAQQLAGNFSSVLTGTTANVCGAGGPPSLNFDTGQLFDPASETQITCPAGSANAGSPALVGNPIAGNIITTVDPVAATLIAGGAYPAPNRAGFPNFVNEQALVRNDSQADVRVDNNFGDKDKIFGRYVFGQAGIVDPTMSNSPLPNFGDTLYFRGQNLAIGWTHTFDANLINEALFGFQRNTDRVNCKQCPRPSGTLANLGIQNLTALSPALDGLPYFGLTTFSGVGDSNYRPISSPDMVEKYQDNVTWVHGRSTIVIGADIQPWQILGELVPVAARGQIYFNGQYSSLANELDGGNAVAGVSDLADFLLGYPYNAARTLRFKDTNQVGGRFISVYGQDDIKLTHNVALNVGLRWEYRRPAIDKNNNYVTLAQVGPEFSGPANALLVTAADDAVNDAFCTDPSYSYLKSADGRCLVATSAQRSQLGFAGRTRRTLIFPDKKDFAPRFGISWQPTGSNRLVVRSGYGIFYDLPNFNNQHFVGNNPIFSPTQFYITNFGAPPPATVETMFAGTAAVPPIVNDFASLFVTPHYLTPYFQQWSFGVQTQFATDWALEVNYIGTKGTRLGNVHLNGNQAEPGTTPLQSRRPYVDFGPMLFTTVDASSSYNSLQAKLTKRFSHGLSLLASYTLAHSIDDAEGDEGTFGGPPASNAAQDDNNLKAERSRSYTDARHRLAVSYVWELPFGKGKPLLNRGGFINQVLGGWELSGVTSFQSGFPFTVNAQDFSNTGSFSPRPDRICSGVGPKSINNWFNTSCFTTTAQQASEAAGHPRFGDSGRNILDGPGLFDWDLGLLKPFQLGERLKFQFRSEFYNAFNHPSLVYLK